MRRFSSAQLREMKSQLREKSIQLREKSTPLVRFRSISDVDRSEVWVQKLYIINDAAKNCFGPDPTGIRRSID